MRFDAIALSLIFVLANVGCRAPRGSTPISKVELREFGYQLRPPSAGLLADYTELSFLSEDRIMISVNQRVFNNNQFLTPARSDDPPANILIVDVQTGRIVSQGSMPAEKNPGAVQVVSDGRLAVWNLKGLQLCTPELRCDAPLAGPGSVAVSPRGTRIVFGGNGMTPFRVLDAESLGEVAKYDDPKGRYGLVLGRGVIPGDAALLITRGTSQFASHRPGKADKVVEFDLGGDFGASRFLNDETFVYLEHSSSEAIVADLDGRQPVERNMCVQAPKCPMIRFKSNQPLCQSLATDDAGIEPEIGSNV